MIRESPLGELTRARGGIHQDYHGWRVAERFSSLSDEYRLARNQAGLSDLSHRPKLRLTGAERVEFLNRITTNDIKNLSPGKGLINVLLTVRGKMVAEMRVFNTEEQVLLDFDPICFDAALEVFIKHRLSTRVEFIPAGEIASLGLLGPRADLLLNTLGIDPAGLDGEMDHVEFSIDQVDIRVIRTARHGANGYELWGSAEALSRIINRLEEALPSPALGWIGWGAINVLRIEAGIPWFGVDMNDDNFPQEALMENAISFTKPCYLGQETMARIKYRGHVNKRLVGLRFEISQAPDPGEKMFGAEQEVGCVTSAVLSPGFAHPIGLGFARKGFDEPGDRLELKRPSGSISCEVVVLPFLSA